MNCSTRCARETSLFVEAIIREDRSILDFIDAPFTFVNGPLARHYGIPGVDGEEFQRVTLDGEQRSGLLTQGAILTVSSYPTRTSPPVRGKWVFENLLGRAAATAARRCAVARRIEHRHRGVAARAAGAASARSELLAVPQPDGPDRLRPRELRCRGRVAYTRRQVRDRDVGHAARRTDVQRGEGVEGDPARGKSDAFTRNLTEKLLTFALGAGSSGSIGPTVEAISRQVAANNYRFSTLVMEIVKSKPFQMRSVEVVKTMNVILKKQLPRRTFLRGCRDRVLALPMLDAMVPAFVRAAAAGPTRMAILYFPNGVQMETWQISGRPLISRGFPTRCRGRSQPLVDISRRHHRAGRADRGRRARARRRPRRPRPRRRQLSDRRSSRRRLSARTSRPAFRWISTPRGEIGKADAVCVARARVRRRNPGRQLRQRV